VLQRTDRKGVRGCDEENSNLNCWFSTTGILPDLHSGIQRRSPTILPSAYRMGDRTEFSADRAGC